MALYPGEDTFPGSELLIPAPVIVDTPPPVDAFVRARPLVEAFPQFSVFCPVNFMQSTEQTGW